MKNEKKRSCLKQYTAGYPLWIIAVLLLLSSCDGGSSLVPVPEPHSETEDSEVISGSELAPNIKLLIKYDEKTYSFATQWPADIVAGTGKAKDEDSEMLLETYENRRVRMEYDTSGVLSEFGSWPEGDASRSIPKEVYEELKNEMPAHSQDYDPIVRWQIVDGMISYFSQSGQAVLSTEVQEEESSHSAVSARIDSVIKANKLPLAERIDRNALTMKKQGLSFKKMDDRHALFDVEADARDKSQHIAGYKQLVDLATGQVIREAVLQEDGRYASFSVMQYKLVQDYPVLASEQNYTFGSLSNGQWGVKNITITNRENLQVGYRAES